MLSFLKKVFAKRPTVYAHPVEHIFSVLENSDIGAQGYAVVDIRLALEAKKILENYEKHKAPSWPDLKEVINTQDKKGNTLLHYFGANLDAFLIEKGANANMLNAFQQTPLMLNAEKISIQNKALITATAELNTPCKDTGETVLCKVLKQPVAQAELIELLINNGANVNQESAGQTPLYTALKHFLNTPFKEAADNSPADTLHITEQQAPQAIAYAHAIILHKHGARLNEEESQKAVNVLRQFNEAVQTGISLPYTLAGTAMVCVDSLSGNTLLPAEFLHTAARLNAYTKQYGSQKAKLFELLSGVYYRGIIQHSPQINAPNKAGETPLKQAFAQKNTQLASALINAGANVAEIDDDNKTLLHKAAILGNPQLALQLLETRKIDVNAQDANGDTALHLTTNDHLAEALLRFGADLTIQNKRGETVFDDVPNIQTALLLSNYLNHVREQRSTKLASQIKMLTTLQEKQATRH